MTILPPLFLFLLGMLPFIIPYQYRPTPVFPSEAVAFILALLSIFLAILRRPQSPRLAATQIYWLVVALFICFQLVFQTTLYYEFKLIPLLFVLTAAGISYALTQFKTQCGIDSLTEGFLFGMLVGGLINTFIAFGQVYISITSETVLRVYGSIGQRNMYGNYLMGGLIAFIYLVNKYHVRWWLTALPLLWLVISLAWTGSRAILLYIAVLFIVSIWMYWRKPALRNFCQLLCIGLILLILAQFLTAYINHFIGWLTGHSGDVPTAIDRLTANGSRRWVEWKKAWLIFKEYPWVGIGWGSFPAYSVRLHAQLPTFYQVVESALFTHAHNSVLNILAENGLFGSLIILGGLGYLVLTFCFRIDSTEKLALSCVLLITLLHSLVEYPLWYFHFFIIFVVCLGLLTPQSWRLPTSGAFIRSGLAVYSVLALTCTGWGCFVYYQLWHWQVPGHEQENTRRLEALAVLQQNPLVDFHAAITASAYIDANHDSPIETLPLLMRLNRSHPYPAQLMDEAILQVRVNNPAAANHLLTLGMYAYPDNLPYFEKSIRQSPYPQVQQLLPHLLEAKRIFARLP